MEDLNPASVVKVGGGRGFVVVNRIKIPAMKSFPCTINGVRRPERFIRSHFVERRLIVTAAHCLPKMPPGQPSFSDERTYRSLLGSLDGSKKNVWAECVFADPIGDVAILDSPDGQASEEFSNAADAYSALVDETPALPIGRARSGRGWILALSSDRWIETTLKARSTMWGPILEVGPTEAGMSGSPILNHAGQVVSIVSQGHETVGENGIREVEDATQPILTLNLPGWLLADRIR